MTTRPIATLVETHKALAHPVRLRLLAMLRGGPLCVCQMTVVVKLAASTVSEHLSDLRHAGLIVERKEGRWVEYRLAASSGARATLDPLWSILDGDADARADAVLVKELRRVSLDELCGVNLDLSRLSRPRLTAAITRATRIRTSAGAAS